ncbi:hypothetical protein TRFO_14585 [Tritrichomonas foetus]|uniref:Sphingomyelin synthase-like domain-containing protein n=1 Tax=Tritrichomonas foetus TaxID=1144522 RepID=A0A1J4KUJ6_9EUKA|nr:hypothetical protein TRFO_14585 [Tritrichomonas foetus]|eukprot:OHT14943.1 hypothetical protein TRFO_14585 [Tritrichomonas foetus]
MEVDEHVEEEIGNLEPLTSVGVAFQGNDIYEVYSAELPYIEFTSKSFYMIQKIEMFLMMIISSAMIIPPAGIEKNTTASFVNWCLDILSLSPSLFQNTLIPYVVMSTIMLSILLIVGYAISLACRCKQGFTQNKNKLSLWVLFHRLVLPLPTIIIGYNIGAFLMKLTTSLSAAPMFLFSLFTALFWAWAMFTSISLYNSKPQQRKNDQCQIHYSYVEFEQYISFLPLIQAATPGIVSALGQTNVDPIISICFVILTSLFSIAFVWMKKPYTFSSMNRFVIFISLVKIPVSLLWYIENNIMDYLNIFLLSLPGFVAIIYGITKLLSSCSSNECNRTTTNEDQERQSEYHFINTSKWIFPFNLLSFQKQDLFLAVFLAISLVMMVLFNALAAQRMPFVTALPDFFHEKFHIDNALRTSPSYGSFQYSNIAVLFIVINLFATLFKYPEMYNVRRSFFIYCILAEVRAISFVITGLPAPCAGSANCPCADKNFEKMFKEGNPVKIAFSWLLGLGMFLKYPQCGDLIVSGHTMFLWIGTRTCVDVLRRCVPRPFNTLLCATMITLTLTAMGYIILAKNHYSIDVWFGFLLPEILWDLYVALQVCAEKPPSPDDNIAVKVIRWLEERPVPVVQTGSITNEL